MPKHKRNDKSRKTNRRGRTARSYDRRQGKQAPGRCILIVCEGAETEPNYFKNLRFELKLASVHIEIKERAGAPISLVNAAQKQVEKRDREIKEGRFNKSKFDAVWCVFDVENPHQNTTFEQAVHHANQEKFHLAISNPAFEFWYILHFEKTSRPFADGKEIKTYLQKNHIPEYNEAMPIFNQLKEFTSTAIDRSKELLENHPQGDDQFPNPSTQVHLLVEEMINMSPSMRQHMR